VGQELQAFDPKHRDFWLAAEPRGDIRDFEEPFEAYIPADETQMGGMTIVNRGSIIIRAKVLRACGKRYLVAVHSNPTSLKGVEATEWDRLKENFSKFETQIKWPE